MRAPLPTPLLLLSLAACGGAGAPEAPARHAVLITCDTLRADRLGCYGYERPTSPNLDAFAREAVVFDEVYATAPMTQPAVSSMLTGRYPLEIGVTFDNQLVMPPEVRTLPEVLTDHGIPSAAVVSNFVLRRPRTGSTGAGVHQGFLHFDDEMTRKEENRVHFERLAPETTDAAIGWLEENAERERFFLWVHYQDPHGPYRPPEEYARRFRDASPGDEPLPLSGSRYGLGGIPTYQLIDGRRDAGFYRDRYDAEIAFFDAEVGRLLDWIEGHGLLEDALVVFTSDHGESLGEHDYWFSHGENLHREVVRVPFVVRYPEGVRGPPTRVEEGYRRCGRVATHLDLWPTVLEAFGVEPPESRGTSLLGGIPERRVVGQVLYPEPQRPRWWAASDGRYRVIWDDERGHRLYDVQEDPGETRDLAAEQPRRLRRLRKDFQGVLEELRGTPLPQGVMLRHNREARRTLEALGYLDSR